jgi:integrase
MCEVLVPSGSAHSMRTLIGQLNAIPEFAVRREMCERPRLELPKVDKPSVEFLMPEQATALVKGAPLHLRPLMVFLIGVGCRPDEAIRLDWRDVDLKGGRARLTLGKVDAKRHSVKLRPVVLRALKALPHRDRRVFRTRITSGKDKRGPIGPGYRGRFATAWASACRKGGLPGETQIWVNKHGVRKTRFAPLHDPYGMQHTLASWHHCVHTNLLLLAEEVGRVDTRMAE